MVSHVAATGLAMGGAERRKTSRDAWKSGKGSTQSRGDKQSAHPYRFSVWHDGRRRISPLQRRSGRMQIISSHSPHVVTCSNLPPGTS